MKLKQLRQEAYSNWETFYSVQNLHSPVVNSLDLTEQEAQRLPYINQDFKHEVRRRFGDLRRRDTWEKAAIAFTAQSMAQSFLEPYQIVGYLVDPAYFNDPVRQHYGVQVVEAMLQFPEVLETVRLGLEQIYSEAVCSDERKLLERFLASGQVLPALTATAA